MAAASWHNKISNFGFLTPYPMLAQVGLLRASDNVIDIGTGCGDFAQAYLAAHSRLNLLFIVAHWKRCMRDKNMMSRFVPI